MEVEMRSRRTRKHTSIIMPASGNSSAGGHAWLNGAKMVTLLPSVCSTVLTAMSGSLAPGSPCSRLRLPQRGVASLSGPMPDSKRNKAAHDEGHRFAIESGGTLSMLSAFCGARMLEGCAC
jgi:hypothetical protein